MDLSHFFLFFGDSIENLRSGRLMKLGSLFCHLSLYPKPLFWLCLGLSLSVSVTQYIFLNHILDGSFPETEARFDSLFFGMLLFEAVIKMNSFFFNYTESINCISRTSDLTISVPMAIAQICTEKIQ